MRSNQNTAESHLLKREMGKDAVQVVVELQACQVCKTTAMQVKLRCTAPCVLQQNVVAYCKYGEVIFAKVLAAVVQLLVAVVAEAGRHLLSEPLDIFYMSQAADSKCRI